jgi:HEAT repeat protein
MTSLGQTNDRSKRTPYWPKAVLLFSGFAAIAVVLVALFYAREPVCQGKRLSYWIGEIANPNTNHQKVARQALREIGPQAIPFLLRKARHEDSVLKRLDREAWFRLPDIAQRNLRQPESKDAALNFLSHALHQLGPPAGPALMKAMEDRNSDVRFAAGASFPYGHDSPTAVLWEIKLLQTADYDLKQSAAAMLGTMGAKAKPAIPALLRVMQHDEIDYVRETAARSLAMLGPEAAVAAPGLNESLCDRLASVRLWSAIALWRIHHDPDAIAVLIADLKTASAEDGTCYAAIRVLGEAGALAKPAVPTVSSIMLQYDPERALPEGAADLIQAAREALRLIDPEIDPVDMLVP